MPRRGSRHDFSCVDREGCGARTDAWSRHREQPRGAHVMATEIHPDLEQSAPNADIDYHVAEGLDGLKAAPGEEDAARQQWMMVGIGLVGLVAVLAIIVA